MTTTIRVQWQNYFTWVAFNAHFNPDAPTLLLTHGNSTSKRIWKKILKELDSNVSYIAVDEVGHGDSSSLFNLDGSVAVPTIMLQAEILIKLLEMLRVKYVVPFGHSMGGHLAIQIAKILEETSKKVKVVGLGFQGTPPIPLKDNPTELPPWAPKPEVLELFPLLTKLEPFTLDEAIPFTAHQGFEKADLDKFAAIAMATHSSGRNIAKSIIDCEGMSDENKFVQSTKLPTCIAHAEHDGAVNLEYLKSLEVPNLFQNKIHVFDGPHGVLFTNSEEFAELLQKFYQSLLNESNFELIKSLMSNDQLKIFHVLGVPRSGTTVTARALLQSDEIDGGVIECFMGATANQRKHDEAPNFEHFNLGLERILAVYRESGKEKCTLLIKDVVSVFSQDQFELLTQLPNWTPIFTRRPQDQQQKSYLRTQGLTSPNNDFNHRMKLITSNWNHYYQLAKNPVLVEFGTPNFDQLFLALRLKPVQVEVWSNYSKFLRAIEIGAAPVNSPWFSTIWSSKGYMAPI